MMPRFFAMILMGILTGLMLAGCAPQTTTRGTSFVDPAYRATVFTALVVEAETTIQERDIIERSAVARLRVAGLTAQPSLDIFPPTREYSQTTKKQMLAKTGMQALLVVTPSGKRVIEDYSPPSHFPMYGGYGHHGGRGHSGFGTGFGYGTYDPGMIYREPQADYIASLYTLPGFKRAWTGEFTAQGSSGMDFDDVAGRFADELVERLAADGMVVLPVK